MLRKELEAVEKKHLRKDLPEFRTGDTVRVHTKIKEGDKERIQVFEGTVIARRRGNSRAMLTVRKVSYGVGVERMFPVHSPRIDRVEVVSHGEVRRARLYYLRQLQGKAARLAREEGPGAEPEGEAPPPAPTTP
ncbi:MAG TPA: 50S ribosomal protein L19 [Anaeromyxobacteraceae bacterium]|nr:50S ribosomal protein L19 [Anaeromyxobacteraceae bacterium]